MKAESSESSEESSDEDEEEVTPVAAQKVKAFCHGGVLVPDGAAAAAVGRCPFFSVWFDPVVPFVDAMQGGKAPAKATEVRGQPD